MIVSHIVAMSENRVIGRAGGMPWHIPEDFKFFKKTTMAHVIIMGRKTYQSIGRLLPGRLTIIITREKAYQAPSGALAMSSIESAIKYCQHHQIEWGDECFIVGGGEIYNQSLKLVDRIYLTIVHTVTDGDTFYPEIPPNTFKQTKSEAHLDAPLPFTFTTLERV
jgi:dihydrofolate reductase